MYYLNFINDLAKENGFSVIGVTNAETSKLTQTRLDEFIQNKFHGSLKWLEDKKEIRKSPKKLWPEAQSAIIFGFNYGPNSNPLPELKQSSNGVVAVYARRKDYHKVLKGRLKQISNKLASKYKTNIKDPIKEEVSFSEIQNIIKYRCGVCHTKKPTFEGFEDAPKGIVFDTPDDIINNLSTIIAQSIDSDIMPPGNITGMTEAERNKLKIWIESGAIINN